MLTAATIKHLFAKLNSELHSSGELAEVGIVGGAVMCLVYNARTATKDIDAIFEPAAVLRKMIKKISMEEDLPADWLNDAAKGFLTNNFKRLTVMSLSNLKVWAPEPKYMLAMKCLSARWDSADKDDVQFLIKMLKLKSANEVFKIIEGYYPKKLIPAKTQFFLEEVFD